MAERRLIFNGKDVQIRYIEGNEVFDLAGRKRCNYTVATGNLSDSNSETVVGHVSLNGTFVGASWLSDELFGKPSLTQTGPTLVLPVYLVQFRPEDRSSFSAYRSSAACSAATLFTDYSRGPRSLAALDQRAVSTP